MKKIIMFTLISLMIIIPSLLRAQDKEARVKQLVENRQYVFVANTAIPLRGGSRQLTSLYDVRISGDSLISDLPYFGRAYAAPVNSADIGLQFTSVENVYNVQATKKGGWEISIRPSRGTDVRMLNLSIYSNGNASLRVSSNNRDPISFNGYITGRKN